jgi:hypothetical protein
MTKRVLKWVGDFKEMGYEDHVGAPSLLELRGKRAAVRKPEVVAYLRKAKAIVYTMGLADNVIDASVHIGTPSLRTDGTYVWPDFTAGYVDRYDVALPDEFERHMEQNQWRLPESLDFNELLLPWQAKGE